MIRGATLVLVPVVAAALAGCGGNSSTTTTTVTTTTTATSSTTTTTATAAETNGTSLGVAKLQAVMTSLGYYSGPIDGIYGTDTTAAVTKMQEDLGVTPADGIFGPETYVALKASAKASKADAKVKAKTTGVVVRIQTTLTKYGYYTGPIDGIYGADTTAAVEKLQADLGVTVDGRVGPETVVAFNKAVANGDIQPTSG
jgi:peptidoglycan hydrolase-like protein with peptidoglycan-binding domain